MSEKFEKIDGKLVISEHALNMMLAKAFDQGAKHGRDVAVAEQQHAEREADIVRVQRLDVKDLIKNATTLRTRKPKKLDKLPPSDDRFEPGNALPVKE